MNDFTKEELKEILLYTSHPIWQDSVLLCKKIQSMIDNYCQHEIHEISALVNYCPLCDKVYLISL
jgi:hypothetical protein